MKAAGHEHRAQHERDRDQRAADLVHALHRGIVGREPGGDVALDVLDDDDRIVDHDADREHQAEQRQVVEREAEHAMKKKVPISDTGIATMGMTAARHVCRNRITTSTTRTIASPIVSMTASTDCWMNWVGL